jgi:uncharacterized membrane protein YoaK (UPF0700 family)
MSERRLHAMVAVLAMTAGATDAISFLGLGGVLSSVMTANMVLLGVSTAYRSGTQAFHVGAALAGYIAGALAASRVTRSPRQPGGRVPAPAVAVLAAEGIVLACVTTGWEVAGEHPAGLTQVALLGAAAASMGSQSAAVNALGIPDL